MSASGPAGPLVVIASVNHFDINTCSCCKSAFLEEKKHLSYFFSFFFISTGTPQSDVLNLLPPIRRYRSFDATPSSLWPHLLSVMPRKALEGF